MKNMSERIRSSSARYSKRARWFSARASCAAFGAVVGLLGCSNTVQSGNPRESKPGAKPSAVVIPLRLQSEKIVIVGDTNRDGTVNNDDFWGRESSSLQRGALLFANNDDSDSDGLPDAQDEVVNGLQDSDDLAHVAIQVQSRYSRASQVVLTLNESAASYVRLFYKSPQGWKSLTESEKTLSFLTDQIEIALEATQVADENWDGKASLRATLLDNASQKVGEDVVQLQVAPWLMLPNTAPVKTFFVRELGELNAQFIAQIKEVLHPLNVKVHVAPTTAIWQDKWMQDTMEVGYSTHITPDGPRANPVVLKAARAEGADLFSRTLLAPSFGWFSRGMPRMLSDADGWTDWFGNLEVTPAISGYPLGRFYYGRSETAALHPAVVAMLNAQKLQGPGVAIDTSWLLIRHVDEIVSFVPGSNGKPLMLVTSPGEGVKVLHAAAAQGAENSEANRGLESSATVRSLLDDDDFIRFNNNVQKNKIDPIIAQLMSEFSFQADQIVHIPALMTNEGDSWMPNMVNSQFVNGHMLVSDPRGPLVNGQDIMKEEFIKRVDKAKAVVHFVNDKVYHEGKGNTHCATNTVRIPPRAAYWTQF